MYSGINRLALLRLQAQHLYEEQAQIADGVQEAMQGGLIEDLPDPGSRASPCSWHRKPRVASPSGTARTMKRKTRMMVNMVTIRCSFWWGALCPTSTCPGVLLSEKGTGKFCLRGKCS